MADEVAQRRAATRVPYPRDAVERAGHPLLAVVDERQRPRGCGQRELDRRSLDELDDARVVVERRARDSIAVDIERGDRRGVPSEQLGRVGLRHVPEQDAAVIGAGHDPGFPVGALLGLEKLGVKHPVVVPDEGCELGAVGDSPESRAVIFPGREQLVAVG
jgi:hypothetical protein